MLEKYFVLVLLPTVVYSFITIHIETIKNGTDAAVKFQGEERSDVSDNDRKVFGIDDGTLKRASEIYMGKRCGDMYVKSPTPWGDVYEKFGWEIVRKTVKPIEARVVGVHSKPVAFSSAEYVNNHESLTVTYSTSLTQEVEETVGHTWSQGGEVGLGMEISYEVDLGVASASATHSMSYTASWGKDTTKSKASMLGSSSQMLVEVPAGQVVKAHIQATKGTMIIQMKYKSILEGRVFCNYPNKFKGHYFYSMPIKGLLDTISVPVVKYSVEKIEIGFYTTARLVVTNGTAH